MGGSRCAVSGEALLWTTHRMIPFSGPGCSGPVSNSAASSPRSAVGSRLTVAVDPEHDRRIVRGPLGHGREGHASIKSVSHDEVPQVVEAGVG